MRIHPAAAVFPEMSAADYDALVEDIRLHGVREPIWVDRDGALLDGRHRFRASEQLGVACPQRTYEGDDPVGHVVSLNQRRRHLTESQKAMLAADLIPFYATQMPAGGRPAKHEAPGPHVSEDNLKPARRPQARDLAAAQVGTSGRSVERCKKIATDSPELAKQVRAGQITAKEAERKIRTQVARERHAQRQAEAEQVAQTGTFFEIRRGDFQSQLDSIPNESVDLVITDPPYGDAFTHLYGELGEWAARKLKPGGSLIAYAGQSNLPDVMKELNQHLRYWWTLALIHKHGSQQMMIKRVLCEWKPLVWFVKDHRANKLFVADRMSGSQPRKDLHAWAQGTDEVAYLIEQLTDAGGLVVDPFAGSGSFGYAAQALGRNFIGAENGSHKDGRQ